MYWLWVPKWCLVLVDQQSWIPCWPAVGILLEQDLTGCTRWSLEVPSKPCSSVKLLLWFLFFQIVQSGRLIVSTKCGHVFCSQCLRDSLRNANSCPTCRKKLTHRQYHPIYIWVLTFLRTDSTGFWGKMSCFQCSEDLSSSRLCTRPNKTDFFENNSRK